MDLRGLYAGRSVFVTGHTGFKGAWLVAWLRHLGANVTGYALDPPTQPNLFDALGLAGQVRHVVADVRDRARLVAQMQAAAPSIVFHLAAQAIVRSSYGHPHETFETNVMGTVNALEAARACPSVGAVVIVTSDKCYEHRGAARPFREDDPLGGHDPYSASKACAEIVTGAYRDSFFGEGPLVASVRAGNVIGGGDWAPDRIVPDCVRALVAGEPVVVRNPDAVRPWQHVLDPLAGYLRLGASLLAEGPAFAGAWNLGPADGTARPVRWLVERFVDEWGEGSWTSFDPGVAQPREAAMLLLDSSRARERLGWEPAWDAETAVARAAAWYRDYYRDPASAPALVAAELEVYEAFEAEQVAPAAAAGATTGPAVVSA